MSSGLLLSSPHNRLEQIQRLVVHVWLFLVVLALLPFTEDPVTPIKEFLTAVAVVIVGAIGLWRAGVASVPLRLNSPILLLLLAWLFLLAMSAAFASAPAQAFFTLRRWTVLVLLALYAAQLFRNPPAVERLFVSAVAALGLASAYGFLQHFGLDPFPWVTRNREEYRGLPASFGNPNFAGHALIVGIILAVVLLTERGRRWPLLPLALMLAHLYVSGMRSGPLALAAAAGIVALGWIFFRRLGYRPHLFLLLCLCLATAAIAAAVGGHYLLKQRWVPVESSLGLRYAALQTASEMVLARPLTGYGPGGYVRDSPPFWTGHEERWFAQKGQRNPYVHNEIVESAIEAGLPGALVLIALYVYALLASLHLASNREAAWRKLGLGLAAAFTALFVDGLFGFNLHVPVSAGLFFLLLGVLEGCTHSAGAVQRPKFFLLLLLLLGSVALAQQTRLVAGEVHYHRAQGALAYARSLPVKAPLRQTLFDEARQRIELAQRLLPWEFRYPHALAQIAQERSQFEPTLYHAGQAVALHPHWPPALLRQAQAHMNRAAALGANPASAPAQAEELAAAEDAAGAALDICAYLGEAEEVYARAAVLRAHGAADPATRESHWRLALLHLDRALELRGPETASMLLLKAQAHLELEEPGNAARVLRTVVEAEPALTRQWLLWDQLMTKQEAQPQYVQALNRALEKLVRDPQAPRESLGAVRHRLGNHAMHALHQPVYARAYHQAAVRDMPMQLDYWGAYLLAEPPPSRLDAAEELGRQVATQPDAALPPVLRPLGGLPELTPEQFAQWARTVAGAAWEGAQGHSAEDVNQQLGWLAELLLQALDQKNLPDAVRGEVLVYAGSTLLDAGRWGEADAALLRAINLLEERHQALPLLLRSRAQAALGATPLALELARQAARLAPGDPEARLQLARLLVRDGALAEANLEYLTLIAQVPEQHPRHEEVAAELAALQEQLATQGGAP